MNSKKSYKIILIKLIYTFSAFVVLLSLTIIAIAYNVSSLKASMINQNTLTWAEETRLRALNPDYYRLASIEISLPDTPPPVVLSPQLYNSIEKFGPKNNNSLYKYIIITLMRPSRITNVNSSLNRITDENYLTKFIEINKPLIEEINTTYEKPFKRDKFIDSSAEGIKIFMKNNNVTPGDCNVELCSDAALTLTDIALQRKKINDALKCDIAVLRLSEIRKPGPKGLYYIGHCLFSENNLALKLFIDNDDWLHDITNIESLKSALLKRIEFIKIFTGYPELIKYSALCTNHLLKAFSLKDRITLESINLWYGDPNKIFYEASRLLNLKPEMSFNEIQRICRELNQKYPRPKSYNYVLAESGEGVESLFKFLLFVLKTHPLPEKFGNISEFDLEQFINIHTKLRLTTFGGLMRIFYAENKRWPDLEKDKEFIKTAGPAAIDPYNNKFFEVIKSQTTETLLIKSEAKDYYDHKSKTTDNIKLYLKKPLGL